MRFPRHARLYTALALVAWCTTSTGICAGFRLGSWWGAGLGALAGMSAVCLGAGIATRLWDLQTEERVQHLLKRCTVNDAKVEADAEAVMTAVTLYEAAVFPVLPGGVSVDERQARRTIAYRVAAYDGVPSTVRVAAAVALEAIDQAQHTDQTQTAVTTLHQAVREYRVGFVTKPRSGGNRADPPVR
ncbi:hypothetical protein [Streptomyces sp. NPDC002952]|uniref:hypothetical protein n=1 Tax=Streptomyces sp. NPDC002952 TaxID=3364673 RepID=UPI0036C06BE3